MRILFFEVTIDYKNTSLTKYQFDPSIIKVVPVLKIFTYSKPTIFLAYGGGGGSPKSIFLRP